MAKKKQVAKDVDLNKGGRFFRPNPGDFVEIPPNNPTEMALALELVKNKVLYSVDEEGRAI